MNKLSLTPPMKVQDVGKFLETLSIVERLAKKKSDIQKRYYDWIILAEEKLELQLIIAFDNAQKEVLSKLNQLEKIYTQKFIKDSIVQLENIPLEPRVKYTTVGITRFKEFTFSVEMRDWLNKSGVDKTINSISFINPDPFNEAISHSVFDSYNMGGNTVFGIFDVGIDFALRDKNVEKFFNNYILKLSEQVSKEISSNIKYTLLEAIKNGDSIPEVRKNILALWNKPIDVKVPPRISPDGTVIRQGYSYQMSPKHWANTVARTEINGAYNAGRLDGFKQSGVVDRVQFSTSPDERLCPICAGLEGMIYTLEQASGVIPQHANCRCQWVPLLATETFDEAKLLAAENIALANQTSMKDYFMENGSAEKEALEFENDIKSILGIKQEQKIFYEDFQKAFNTGSEFKTDVEIMPLGRDNFRVSGHLKAQKDYNNLQWYTTETRYGESKQILHEKSYKSGDEIGSFHRNFQRRSIVTEGKQISEKLIVDHDSFFLEGAFQNRQIGKELFRNQIQFYEKYNVYKITVHANGDVGLYAWAKYGFDFESDITLRNYARAFSGYIEQKAGVIVDTSNFKHSWDFATYNKTINGVKISGKDFMLNRGWWRGELLLDKNGNSIKILKNYIGMK